MENRSLPSPSDPASPGPARYSPEESIQRLSRSPSMRFSTVGMSNEAAKLHNVSRTKSRRASESGPMDASVAASYSLEGSVGERSAVSTSSPYGFGSSSRDHALKLYHGPGLEVTRGTEGAEPVYEPHKCLDHMRRKAPTTRIAEGGLSTEERVARYTRFPDLKPPNAADALTADEYVAIVGRLPEPVSATGDQCLSQWRNPYTVRFGVGPRADPGGIPVESPGMAHNHPQSAFARQQAGSQRNAPSYTFGRGPGHRGLPLVGEGSPPRGGTRTDRAAHAPSSRGGRASKFSWLYGETPLPDEEARELQRRERQRELRRRRSQSQAGRRGSAGSEADADRESILRSVALPVMARGFSFGAGKRFNDREYTPHSPSLAGSAALGPGPAAYGPRSSLGGVGLPFPAKVDRTPIEYQIAAREQFPGPGAYDPDPLADFLEQTYWEEAAGEEDEDELEEEEGKGEKEEGEGKEEEEGAPGRVPRSLPRMGRASAPSLHAGPSSPGSRGSRSPSPLRSGSSVFSAARSHGRSAMTSLASVPTTRELPTKRRSPSVSFAGSQRPALYAHSESPGPVYDPKGKEMGSGSPSLSFLGSKIERSTIAGRDLCTRNVPMLGPATSPLKSKPSSRAGSLSRSGRDVTLHFGPSMPGERGRGTPGPGTYEGAEAAALKLARALKGV